MTSPLLPINAVVRRTGLSVHVIRVWEKRYGAVLPERSATRRRLYSEEQVERLGLLRQLTLSGQSIGYVARLSTTRLRALAAASVSSQTSFPASGLASAEAAPLAQVSVSIPVPPPADSSVLLDKGMVAVKALDSRALDQVLVEAEVSFGALGMLQRVAAPLAQALGSLWRDGLITAAHEHFASSVLRTFLSQTARRLVPEPDAPVLLVATPAGQLHELGALLVAAYAANLGWRVAYLGANLPAAEIAGAARQSCARALALSLVYPEDDSHLAAELSRLRELLPAEFPFLVGGRASDAYQAVLQGLGALRIADLTQLGLTLDALRKAGACLK